MPPVLSALAPAYLLPSEITNISCLALQNRSARRVPVPSPCRAIPSTMKTSARQYAKVNILLPCQMILSDNLGNLISWDAMLVERLGWGYFLEQCRRRGDFFSLVAVQHTARHQ